MHKNYHCLFELCSHALTSLLLYLQHDKQENVHITNLESTSSPPTTESLKNTPPNVSTNSAEKVRFDRKYKV